MEENFNSEEKLNAEEPALSKEEVLARSRKENEKNGDEREQGRRLWPINVGFIVTVLACAVAVIVRICIQQAVVFYDLTLIIIFSWLGAQNITEAVITENKKVKVLTIIMAVLSFGVTVFYWVEYGLSLPGK